MYLSIDIGLKNLGYALYDKEHDELTFDVYDVDSHLRNKRKDLVVSRSNILHDFIKDLFTKHDIGEVIIERQVNSNTQAMEMMYLLTGILTNYNVKVKIFDPKQKFTRLNIKYDTKNKAHKKLSVSIVKNYIKTTYPDLLERFTSYKKLDDISDAILMLFVEVYKKNTPMLCKLKGSME